MCFAIRNIEHLRELRTRDLNKYQRSYLEAEARFKLGEAYVPPEFDRPVVEPDRAVPVFDTPSRVLVH